MSGAVSASIGGGSQRAARGRARERVGRAGVGGGRVEREYPSGFAKFQCSCRRYLQGPCTGLCKHVKGKREHVTMEGAGASKAREGALLEAPSIPGYWNGWFTLWPWRTGRLGGRDGQLRTSFCTLMSHQNTEQSSYFPMLC